MTSAASRPRPPSVERVLSAARPATAGRDPAAVLAMARAVVDEERARLAGPTPSGAPRSPEALGAEVAARLAALEHVAGPERVINATGVIVHTNLGRAPWPEAAIRAAREAAEGTLFLELDRATGRRGRRYREAEAHLVALTGAEDALIVTNNAAAVALAVGLAGRGGVAVSRGELVEIGGGVRIPEIVRRAGAKLVEVGTTNRTRASRLRGGPRGRPGAAGASGPPVELQPGRVRRGARCRRPSRRPPTGSARSSSTTSAAARCSTPRRSGWPTSRCRASGWPTGRTSSRSAATSSSAGPRPGSSSAAPTSSRACGRTRSRGRCARTRSSSPRSPPRSRCIAPASPRATIPVWRQISASVEATGVAGRGDRRGGGCAAPASRRSRRRSAAARCRARCCRREPCACAAAKPDRLLARLRAGTPAVVGRVERGAVLLDLRSVDPADDAALVGGDPGGAGRRCLSRRRPTPAGASSSGPPGTSTTARPACSGR